mmetsp:Transcript_111288/g.214460  ORF Transcript_111288/g.214460 Transcript_111288/m.214460 type:complete len:148 (+) Transcript_111288:39-482(+)
MLEEALDSMRKLGVSTEKLAAAEARLQKATEALHARKVNQAPPEQRGAQEMLNSLRDAVGCNADGTVDKDWPPAHATAETVRAAIGQCTSSIQRWAILKELESLFDLCSEAWCKQRGSAAEGVGSDILSVIEEGMRHCREEQLALAN